MCMHILQSNYKEYTQKKYAVFLFSIKSNERKQKNNLLTF